MEIADSNLKDSGPRSGTSHSGASRVAKESAIGKRVVVGIGLLVLALVLWWLRDTVPSWMARSMAATVELATTSERDDARVTRAFDAAMHVYSADATLESLPNQIRVRHTRLTVRAPTSDEAIEMASRMSQAMASAFAKEGPAMLSVDVRRRATAVEDSTTTAAGYAMRLGAAVAGLLGVLLIALGWFRLQAGPDHLPRQFWWLAAGGSALAMAPVFLPGDVIMALFFMVLPVSVAGVILWRGTRVRHAAAWPSTRGRIVRSTLRAQHHRQQAAVTKVSNVADVEYEYTLGDRVFRGTRIGIGDSASGRLEQTLNHYSVGATVPVYYDPKNPENALLERDPPVPVGWLYAIAAAIFLGGLVVLAAFWNISAIFEGLSAYFPEKAFLPGMAFFTLGGVMLVAMLWMARRQVAEASGWPAIGGRIVKSGVEHYRKRVGGAQSGTLTTFYEPVVEYSYRVNDHEYHSTQVSFGGKSASSQAIAEAAAARYPTGNLVLVHYDPKNPSNAVLELKVALGVPLLAVAIAFFGLAIFFSGVFR
jgi:Protein of unknown function (DUF3592)